MTLTLLPQRHVRPKRPAIGDAPARVTTDIDRSELHRLRELFDGVRGGVSIALSGFDGSGKSTLAEQLVDVLQAAGISVRLHHRFHWYTNLLSTPGMIRRHRRNGRGVRVFDRTVYDNLASLIARAPRLAGAVQWVARRIARRYPSFDVRLHLRATWDETAARRPGITATRYERFTSAYDAVTGITGFVPVQSGSGTLAAALAKLQTALRERANSRRVILHADDLGLTYAFNAGIQRAHRDGLLTSTSIRANGYAYRHAVEQVLPACPRLRVGLHLCLNEAEPVAPPNEIAKLLDESGRLRSGYAWLMRLCWRPAGRAQIERELRAQIERVLADGVPVAHFDSHQHVHMIPGIFHIVCRLACEYGIDCVRLTREPAHGVGPIRKRFAPWFNGNAIKHWLLNRFARRNVRTARAFGLRAADAFVGVNHTGAMTADSVLAGLKAAGEGTIEVLLHPTIGPDARDTTYPADYLRAYVCAPQRRVELETLVGEELRTKLHKRGWQLRDYRSACSAQPIGPPPNCVATISPEIHRLCATVIAHNPLSVSTAQADARAFAEIVVSQAKSGQRVLDLGAGSGILAICLAKRGIDVVATDVCPRSVATTQRNAAANGVRFPCVQGDLLDAVDGAFDVIAFNLPYNFRPDSAFTNVAKNLARRIPFVCRNSGTAIPNGVLHFHRWLVERLFEQVFAHLRPGGLVLLHAFDFEVGIFRRMLPARASVEVLRHPVFRAHRTVAMVIRADAFGLAGVDGEDVPQRTGQRHAIEQASCR